MRIVKEFLTGAYWLQLLICFGAVVAMVMGILKLLEGNALYDWRFWTILAVSLLPLVLVFFFNLLPHLSERRRIRTEIGAPRGGPQYFRLDPYSDSQ